MKALNLAMVLMIGLVSPLAGADDGREPIKHPTCQVYMAHPFWSTQDTVVAAIKKGMIEKGYVPVSLSSSELSSDTFEASLSVGDLILRRSLDVGVNRCEVIVDLVKVVSHGPVRYGSLYSAEALVKRFPLCSLKPEKAVERVLADMPSCTAE